MAEMKSARERAMERVERLGEASPEERLRWKYLPQGEALAAGLLRDQRNLVAELAGFDEAARKYVVEGALQVLLKTMDLPKNEVIKKNTRKAMDAIKAMKADKVGVENVYSKMRRVFSHYEQEGAGQRRQALESVKQDFQAKLAQAMRQQYGAAAAVNMNVETHPQFQEEWRRVQAQLDSQYYKLLDEYKRELQAIS